MSVDQLQETLEGLRKSVSSIEYKGWDAHFGAQSKTTFTNEIKHDLEVILENIDEALATVNKYWREE